MLCLVLGGNGFIGSHLVDKLLSEGHKVRIFDRYHELYRDKNSEIEYYIGSFNDRALVIRALQGVDMVYHLISTTLPKTSNDNPEYDIQSNVIDSIFLLQQCVGKVGKIVYLSSGGAVYGRNNTLPIREDSPTEPESSYGISKLTVEKYLSLFNRLYGLDYVILRPSNPFGPRQNPNHIQGAISVFLGRLAKNERIQIWGDGEVVRDYIYIDDLILGIYLASTTETHSKIFNLGSGSGVSLNNLLDIIRNVTSKDLIIDYQRERKFDVNINFLDVKRAQEELFWMPTTKLDNGIQKTWEFISSLTFSK